MGTEPPDAGSVDPDEVYRQLAENEDAPHGRARVARAEELVELAGLSGHPPLLIDALQELINAYERSDERPKLLVPFARVLRMWDTRPSDFTEPQTFWLHWQFKWATTGMLADPRVPLATIERWLAEMAARYRVAGHEARAVHMAEFHIAYHIGDRSRAQAAFDRWLASDRDEISDCQACERHTQGEWHAACDDDRAALDRWAPVLDGWYTCETEPHGVLARSLLPLLRLDDAAQARANHLRGYRMARSVPDLRGAVGRHVEFCALTGNEARGLEILAEHTFWLDAGAVTLDHLEFLRGCAVLLRRLDLLGHHDVPVPWPSGQMWTVHTVQEKVAAELTALAGRFDARNGTDAVGRRVRADLVREPLRESLPLGLRATLPAGAGPTGAGARGERRAVPGGPDSAAPDLAALLATARELTDLGHPGTQAAWRRVSQAGAGAELDPLARAELTDQQGRAAGRHDPADARRLLLDAAERFDGLGLPARAVCARARAALARALPGTDGAGGDQAADTETAAALRAITALAASGAATPADVVTVRLCRAHALFLGTEGADPASGPVTELTAELDAALALADTHGDTVRSTQVRSLSARVLMRAGEFDQAEHVLHAAVDAAQRAEMPWLAGEPDLMLGRIRLVRGDLAGAEQVARRALALAARRPELDGYLHLLLAEVLLRQDRPEEAATSALDASQVFDTVGEPGTAAHARVLLAQAYRATDRTGEAAVILEGALPDVAAHHDQVDVTRVRQALAACLSDLGEYRPAAEQLLTAAEVAQSWPDQRPHALLASDAAQALAAAGLADEATRTFERAARLWRELGETGPYVRTLRATAWHLNDLDEDPTRALDLMARARRVLAETAEAAGTDTAGHGAFDRAFETAETFDQSARLLARAAGDAGTEVNGDLAEQALDCALRAAEGFAGCGAERWNDLIGARFLAAQIEADRLDRTDASTRRLREVITECEHRDDPVAARWLARCRSVLRDRGEQ